MTTQKKPNEQTVTFQEGVRRLKTHGGTLRYKTWKSHTHFSFENGELYCKHFPDMPASCLVGCMMEDGWFYTPPKLNLNEAVSIMVSNGGIIKREDWGYETKLTIDKSTRELLVRREPYVRKYPFTLDDFQKGWFHISQDQTH